MKRKVNFRILFLILLSLYTLCNTRTRWHYNIDRVEYGFLKVYFKKSFIAFEYNCLRYCKCVSVPIVKIVNISTIFCLLRYLFIFFFCILKYLFQWTCAIMLSWHFILFFFENPTRTYAFKYFLLITVDKPSTMRLINSSYRKYLNTHYYIKFTEFKTR